jgi:quercetin dioxygenase-like cupin family protein
MALFCPAKSVPEAHVDMKVSGGALSTKQVFGLESSLMIARRSAGYHSRAHVHDAEQLNYVMEGEIWIFVEEVAFHLKKGDFLRIPRLAVHWAWNKSDSDVVLLESHTPGLDILSRDKTVDLLDANEREDDIRRARNIWAAESYMEIENNHAQAHNTVETGSGKD